MEHNSRRISTTYKRFIFSAMFTHRAPEDRNHLLNSFAFKPVNHLFALIK